MSAFTHGDGQDVLAAFKQAWERRDPDAGTDVFADDAEFRTDPFEEPLRGSVEIRQYWNNVAAGLVNTEFDAERIWVAGTTVLTSWHAAATDRATGERRRYRGFMTLELDDQRAVVRGRQWTVWRAVGTDSTIRAQPPGDGSDGG